MKRLYSTLFSMLFFSLFLWHTAYPHSSALHSWDPEDHNPNYAGNMSKNAMEVCDNQWGVAWLSTPYKNEIHDGAWDEDEKGDIRYIDHGYNPITNTTGGTFEGGKTALVRSLELWNDLQMAFNSGRLTGGDGVGAYHYLGRCCHLLQDMTTYVHIHPQDISGLPYDPIYMEHQFFEDAESAAFQNTIVSDTLPLYLPTDSLDTNTHSIDKLDTFSVQRLKSKVFDRNTIESFIEQVARITYFRSTFWGEVVFKIDTYSSSNGDATSPLTSTTTFSDGTVSPKDNILHTMFGAGNVRYVNTWSDDYFEITDQDGSALTWENNFDDQWFPCAEGTQDGHQVVPSGSDPVNAEVRTTGRFHFTTAYHVNPLKYPDGSTFTDSSLGYYMCKYANETGISYNAALIGVGSRKCQTLTIQSSNPDSGVPIQVSPTDAHNDGNGTTHFTRTYIYGTKLTLTAPALVSGNSFSCWQKNGIPISTNNSIDIIIKNNDTYTVVYAIIGTLSTPTFAPLGGVYNGPIEISMSCFPVDANIYYTTDGTDPTENSYLFLGPVLIYSDTLLKAAAFRSDWIPSDIASSEYRIYPDFNNDHTINWEDVSILSYYWDQLCKEPSWCQGADCNRNGIADLDDFFFICDKWLNVYADNE